MIAQLQKKEAECEELAAAQCKSVHEGEERQRKQTALEEAIKLQQSQMKQLHQEVEKKSELVRVFCSTHSR